VNTHLPDIAKSFFEEGFSCSQAVFTSFAIDQGMDRETALRVSGAFGGGMAKRGEICGAVSGAFMAIGLKYAKIRADDNASRDTTYALCSEFTRQFEEKFGSVQCRDILGYNLGRMDEYNAAIEAGVMRQKCSQVVEHAAQVLSDIV
jgi:C_GCAxxG_C_C family probable redox protein